MNFHVHETPPARQIIILALVKISVVGPLCGFTTVLVWLSFIMARAKLENLLLLLSKPKLHTKVARNFFPSIIADYSS